MSVLDMTRTNLIASGIPIYGTFQNALALLAALLIDRGQVVVAVHTCVATTRRHLRLAQTLPTILQIKQLSSRMT